MKTKDLRMYSKTRVALLEAEYFLAAAKVSGEKYVKFLHAEGRVSLLLRRLLRLYKKEGRLHFLIKGENFSLSHAATRYLLDRYPEVSEDESLEKLDPCITVVCLTV